MSKRSSVLPIFIATIPPSDGPDALSSPSTLGPADLEVLRLAMLKGESKKQVDNSQAESSTSNVQTVVDTRRKSTRGIAAESTVAADAPFETTARPNLTAPRGKRGRGLVKSGPTTSTRRKPIAKKPEAIEPVSSVEDSQLSSPLSDVISNDEFVPVSDRAQSRSLRRIVPSQPSISVPSSSSGLTLRSKRQLGSDEPTMRNDSIEAKTSPHTKRHKIDGSREQSAQSEGATPASPLGSVSSSRWGFVRKKLKLYSQRSFSQNPEDNPRLASQSN